MSVALRSFSPRDNDTPLPTIHILSDSVGITAQAVARAASSQFGVPAPALEVLPQVTSFEEIQQFFKYHSAYHKEKLDDERIVVFYTFADGTLRRLTKEYAESHPEVIAVDVLGPALDALSQASGLEPREQPGGMHGAHETYFRRIEALEFTIEHDDGRNPQDLTQADIVLLGVSRSSKTPISIYLSHEGYKVANVPLDLHTEPPKEIFDVDKRRLFGLVTSPEVLIGVRQRRLGNAGAVAASYADPEYVYQDLEHARALMRKLGCIVIHTENRGVEEAAQEILRYYERIGASRRKGGE